MAAALKNEPDLQVELVDGGKGEFTVNVDGRTVIRKETSMPTEEEILAAVQKATHSGAGV